jgi:hypothetical protein
LPAARIFTRRYGASLLVIAEPELERARCCIEDYVTPAHDGAKKSSHSPPQAMLLSEGREISSLVSFFSGGFTQSARIMRRDAVSQSN